MRARGEGENNQIALVERDRDENRDDGTGKWIFDKNTENNYFSHLFSTIKTFILRINELTLVIDTHPRPRGVEEGGPLRIFPKWGHKTTLWGYNDTY